MIPPDNRDELLYSLTTMGVELPRRTKLSVESLDKKLRKALEFSQGIKDVLKGGNSVDASILEEWTSSLFKNINKTSYEEASLNFYALQLTGEKHSPGLYVNPFYDLRQTLMGIGDAYDRGVKISLVRDKDSTHNIVIRASAIFLQARTELTTTRFI